jgi:signal transduction histidine kinase
VSAKGALIRILNKETGQFEVRAAGGIGEKYLHKGPVTTEKLISDQQNLHAVIQITDIWNAMRVEYPQQAWDEGIRMILDVPLAIESQLIGLIRIYLDAPRNFTDSELDFMASIAELCACIIERVRHMESQQARFTHMAAHVDKLSSLGRMAAGVAHEINNPLTGILLFSSNMVKKVPDGSQLQDGLRVIMKETQRCKTIIQGLLDFARDVKPEKNAADVNQIMRSALAVVENEFRLQHVQIKTRLCDDMQKTYLDENQIQQVFINILLNALQAVDKKGLIKVQTQVDMPAQKINVTIADNGCGIAPNLLDKIFEPFYSTKNNGTGLGLAVSFGIVKNHHGEIRASSKPGQGTRFVVQFPIVSDAANVKDVDESDNDSSHR